MAWILSLAILRSSSLSSWNDCCNFASTMARNVLPSASFILTPTSNSNGLVRIALCQLLLIAFCTAFTCRYHSSGLSIDSLVKTGIMVRCTRST
uniref:Secreted protein n=1 Tax=Anopheles quadriannulatus TaxID=34691 RepID=A0A182XU44_ANOQN